MYLVFERLGERMFKLYEMISCIWAKGVNISYDSAEDNLFYLKLVFK
jgi:hypothetical protein